MPTVSQIAGMVFRTVIQVVIMDSLYLTTGIIWIYLGNIWTKTGTKGELRTTSSFNDQFLVFYSRKRPVSRTKLSHFDKSFWLKNHSSVNEVGMTVHIDRPLSFKPTGWKTYVKVPTWSGPWIPDWRVGEPFSVLLTNQDPLSIRFQSCIILCLTFCEWRSERNIPNAYFKLV